MPDRLVTDRLRRSRAWLRASVAINRRVQVQATQVTLRRLFVAAWLVIALNLVYTVWFLGFQLGSATPASRLWILLVGGAHTISAVLQAVLVIASQGLSRQPEVHEYPALALHVAMVVVALALGAGLSVADQLVAANTTMFALISLSVAMLSLMRPALSMAIFLTVYLVFFFCVPLTQPDPQLLAISRSHAFAATLVSVMASSLMWRQYVQSTVLAWEVQSAQIALTAKQAELEYLATHDSLTGLLNRREFMRQLEQERVRALRHPAPTSLIMVDLDFFKKVNDTYGHPAGDTVLAAVASAIAHSVRKSDVLARLGGEEFIVLLPNTDLAGASGVGQKLLTQIRALKIPFANLQLRVTASVGVSSVRPGAEQSPDALYTAADKALYLAKHSGRDRVELAPQAQSPPA